MVRFYNLPPGHGDSRDNTADDSRGSSDDSAVIGGVLGSLIVLILLAIIGLQLLRMAWKRKQMHTQQGKDITLPISIVCSNNTFQNK